MIEVAKDRSEPALDFLVLDLAETEKTRLVGLLDAQSHKLYVFLVTSEQTSNGR